MIGHQWVELVTTTSCNETAFGCTGHHQLIDCFCFTKWLCICLNGWKVVLIHVEHKCMRLFLFPPILLMQHDPRNTIKLVMRHGRQRRTCIVQCHMHCLVTWQEASHHQHSQSSLLVWNPPPTTASTLNNSSTPTLSTDDYLPYLPFLLSSWITLIHSVQLTSSACKHCSKHFRDKPKKPCPFIRSVLFLLLRDFFTFFWTTTVGQSPPTTSYNKTRQRVQGDLQQS